MTSGADSEPTVPTGAEAMAAAAADTVDDEDVVLVEEATVCGHGEACVIVLIDGNDDPELEPEPPEDVVGIDGRGFEAGGADTVVVGAVTVVVELGGETAGGAVCAQAPAVVVRKNTPARPARETNPVRDLAFDSLRIIAGDP